MIIIFRRRKYMRTFLIYFYYGNWQLISNFERKGTDIQNLKLNS